MSTRCLICIWWKGGWYLAQYASHSGYPDGQGLHIFKFLIVPGNIEKLKIGLEGCVYEVTSDEAEEMSEMYPSLCGTTGAYVLTIIAGRATSKSNMAIPLQLNLEFANDSAFCEWAYVIDLDDEVLEIYRGSQRKTEENHRFKDVGEPRYRVPRLFCSFTFADLAEMKTEEVYVKRINEIREQKKDEVDDW
ncbi:hypothetical protein CVT24_000508 [Panaeolus cyanescens]|uniref:Uncharacterized protein n=1 Tax=Panaeolus cyanescens TaxID=181874 RepID=A0A409V8E7_9AGAR|nr:hypothetical protein CVT24_000508 [Panaeolus cyanescens]